MDRGLGCVVPGGARRKCLRLKARSASKLPGIARPGTHEEAAVPSLSKADHSLSPPLIDIPRDYNAACDLVERNLAAGRGGKTAYIDDAGRYTFAELAERVNRAAGALTSLGLEMEQRIMVALLDGIEFPSVFLGAIKAGIVPVAANTLLTSADYEYMLEDS